MPSMDPDNVVMFDAMPFFRIYESGRMHRTDVIKSVPPSVDAATGVSSKDVAISRDPDVSARLYIRTAVVAVGSSSPPRRRLPVVVYYHGGGFCLGSKSDATLHSYLNSLVAQADVLLVSVDYRLATEHPVPAAYDDSWLALRWVAAHAEAAGGGGGGTEEEEEEEEAWLVGHGDFGRVFLAGDSAGANIAHNVALRAGGAEGLDVKGLVLFHPYFLDTEPTESDAIDARMSGGLKKLWAIVCPSTTGLDVDHRINPLAEGAPSLSGLGEGCERVLVCTAGRDALRDRGRAYYERLRRCGWRGRAELHETEGEGHVFHVMKPACEETLALTRKVSSFLNSSSSSSSSSSS